MQRRLTSIAKWKVARRWLAISIGACIFSMLTVGVSLAQKGDSSSKKTVHGLRIGFHGFKTRIVLDMDGPTRFQTFSLADPYRVVLDLPEVNFHIDVTNKVTGNGVVSGYRSGLFEPGISRVVIDLKEPQMITKAFQLLPGDGRGHRLVIDLKKVGRAEFRVASEKSMQKLLEARRRAPLSKTVATPRTETPIISSQNSSSKKRIIVLDPGHGGVDPGAIGPSGTYEKTVVLAAARTLKQELQKTGRYTVVLTRSSDRFLRLRQRVAVSRSVGADLFISIHADSIADKRLRGASIYTLSEQSSDKEAARLAEQENKSDIIAGVDLSTETPKVTNILIEMVQRETMNDSKRFAKFLTPELRNSVRTHRRAHRSAGFAVLKSPDVPSLLLEMGYLSNPEEERMLRSRAFQEKVAVAMRRGIDLYFDDVQSAAR